MEFIRTKADVRRFVSSLPDIDVGFLSPDPSDHPHSTQCGFVQCERFSFNLRCLFLQNTSSPDPRQFWAEIALPFIDAHFYAPLTEDEAIATVWNLRKYFNRNIKYLRADERRKKAAEG